MPSLKSLKVAARAASYLPLHQLIGHVRRRARDRIVPMRAESYLASLHADAATLPPVGSVPTVAAQSAAATVALFFGAKHTKNVPQCFDGRFTFLNKTHDFGGADKVAWRIDMDDGRYQLWRANLSFMGYLCTAADADPDRALTLAATLIDSFMALSTFSNRTDFSDMWNSYPVAQRILALSAILIRLPQEFADRPERATIEAFLRFNVAYLLRNLETELGFNHLERNLSALALYSLAAQAMPAAIEKALRANFAHVIGETVGEDGVQFERSPMYQGFVVQSLRVLRALGMWRADEAALIARRLAAVEDALAAMTLGDDRPSLMNDGWFDETPLASAILGEVRTPGFTVLPDGGYVRLAQGDAIALFDAGPVGPNANPGHGHSDFLSVELSLGTDRLIVDPGTPMYSPGPERNAARSWASHNGPAVQGVEPVEYLGSFKVGRRVAARLDGSGQQDDRQYASGSLAFGSIKVARTVTMSPSELVLEDVWSGGTGERGSRFLIPDSWTAVTDGPDAVLLSLGERRVSVMVENGSISLGEGQRSCRYNLIERAHSIVMRPQSDRATIRFDWR